VANFTLKNFKKQFSDDAKLWAVKCTVRECDEESRGHFLAFVDQGEESFDVSVTIAKDVIDEIKCDCIKGDAYCAHKLALLLFITNNEKVKPLKIVKRKISPLDLVFENIQFTDVKDWLLSTFEKDKPLQLNFLNFFSKKESRIFSEKEITAKLMDARRAVLGSKRIIDGRQLKQLTSLWEPIFIEVCQVYFDHPEVRANFNAIKMCMNLISNQAGNLNSNSFSAHDTLEKNIRKKISEVLHEVSDFDIFIKAISYLFENIQSNNYYYESNFLKIIVQTFELLNTQKKLYVLEHFCELIIDINKNKFFGDNHLTKAMFKMVLETNSIEKYLLDIKPVSYENKHNSDLISYLVEYKHFDLANTYCLAIIQNNSQDFYNLHYFNFLKVISAITQDNSAYLSILDKIVPVTLQIEDYKLCYENKEPGSDRDYWRNQLLAQVRAKVKRESIYRDMKFCVDLVGYEKNYDKLHAYLGDYPYVSMFMPYFDELLAQNLELTLKQLLFNSKTVKPKKDGVIEFKEMEFFEPFTIILEKHVSPAAFKEILIKNESKAYSLMDRYSLINYLWQKYVGEITPKKVTGLYFRN
jgi:hypothetical protein